MTDPQRYTSYLFVPYRLRGRTEKGWDCYGLYRYVLYRDHGVLVDSYEKEYPDTESKKTDLSISEAISKATGGEKWNRVELGSETNGCAIVFNLFGEPLHCGYVIRPGTMLHAMKGRGTCIERYDSPSWIKRIEGIYKWN